jgi:hypothetical protein
MENLDSIFQVKMNIQEALSDLLKCGEIKLTTFDAENAVRTPVPVMFFGDSLGAIIAYELASYINRVPSPLELESNNYPRLLDFEGREFLVSSLIASSCPAPHVYL